jgi:hypothetical protein
MCVRACVCMLCISFTFSHFSTIRQIPTMQTTQQISISSFASWRYFSSLAALLVSPLNQETNSHSHGSTFSHCTRHASPTRSHDRRCATVHHLTRRFFFAPHVPAPWMLRCTGRVLVLLSLACERWRFSGCVVQSGVFCTNATSLGRDGFRWRCFRRDAVGIGWGWKCRCYVVQRDGRGWARLGPAV